MPHVRFRGCSMGTVTLQNEPQHMQVTELSEHTGVAVEGVDLGAPLAEADRQRMAQLFVERSVMVVRKQKLDPHGVLRAVQNFGDVFEQQNTRFSVPECPLIHYLSNEDRYPDGKRYIPGSGYHTDHSNDLEPPKATALYAVDLPSTGGDTQFANMAEAYDALPGALRTRIDGKRARHVYQSHLSKRKLMSLTKDREERVKEGTLHPLVRTHPETGRRAIFMNPIRIDQIEGLEESETVALLDALLEHATSKRFEYRHRWQPGDFLMWDNRCLLHKANGDYDMNERRYLYRVMLQGDKPH